MQFDETSDRDEEFSPGDIYEDTFLHPCLCLEVDNDAGDVWGISLIDGSCPRTTSLDFSGIRKLTIKEVFEIKKKFVGSAFPFGE